MFNYIIIMLCSIVLRYVMFHYIALCYYCFTIWRYIMFYYIALRCVVLYCVMLYIVIFYQLPFDSLLKKRIEARSFLHRQIWSNIKLYRNILQFSLLLSDSKLKQLALDSLLNRYIMLGLQCAGTTDATRRIKAVSPSSLSLYSTQ